MNISKKNVNYLRRVFQFKDELPSSYAEIVSEIKGEQNAVCVVFRRGDYVNHPVLGIVGLDFYYKAINLLKTQICNPVFFVFSDDIPWCKEILIFKMSLYILSIRNIQVLLLEIICN